MSEELKVCPFCGGRAITHRGATPLKWRASCTQCDCSPHIVGNSTEAEAIAAWNTRAPIERLEAENRQMREALEFYADHENWFAFYTTGDSPINSDWDAIPAPGYPDGKPGRLARNALAGLPVQPSQAGNFGDLDGGAPNHFDPSKRGFQP